MRTRKLYREVQIGNLTNELRKLEQELLTKEMTCFDIAERYGTDSPQYEAHVSATMAVRVEIEDVKTQLDEHLQYV